MLSNKKTIYHFLIVDDEAEWREAVAQWIKAKYPHAKVVTATNGFEAFQKISMQKFNIVITDVKMPKMDGIGLIQTMYKVPKDFIPDNVIVISDPLDPGATAPEELQSISVFLKPLKRDYFLNYVEKIIQTRIKEDAAQQGRIDNTILNSLLDGTSRYFLAKYNTSLQKLEPVAKQNQPAGDISALVELSTVNYTCTFALGFSETLFLSLANSDRKKKAKNIVLEHHDLIKKICIDILLEAKTLCDEQGETMQYRQPQVTIGKNHTATHPIVAPGLHVDFETPQGKMCFEIVMKFKAKNPLEKK